MTLSGMWRSMHCCTRLFMRLLVGLCKKRTNDLVVCMHLPLCKGLSNHLFCHASAIVGVRESGESDKCSQCTCKDWKSVQTELIPYSLVGEPVGNGSGFIYLQLHITPAFVDANLASPCPLQWLTWFYLQEQGACLGEPGWGRCDSDGRGEGGDCARPPRAPSEGQQVRRDGSSGSLGLILPVRASVHIRVILL
ncbi:hypothetical protein BV20DRAFT_213157 [Pilatotrama ljubarskyi]|nr:hypothetical protein BV20DRAFT_213157 [Pilatotrama ljubarskyi]